MADTCSIQGSLAYYTQAAANLPTLNFVPSAYATPPPTKNMQTRVLAAITPTALSLATFATVYGFAAKNLDAVNFVEMTYTYTDAGAVDRVSYARIPAGGVMVLTTTFKISAGLSFTANTAPVSLDVALVGV